MSVLINFWEENRDIALAKWHYRTFTLSKRMWKTISHLPSLQILARLDTSDI